MAEYSGRFNLDRALDPEQYEYLKKFSQTRRMKRDTKLTEKRADSARRGSVNLPVGEEGCYFVGETGYGGQDKGEDVIDANRPPEGQPGLWCQWMPTEDCKGIEWDGGEKFYNDSEWLEYIIAHFLKPWGYVLNGTVKVKVYGSNAGRIKVVKNEITERWM